MSHYTNVPSSQGAEFSVHDSTDGTDLARAFGQRRGSGAPVRRDFIERSEGGSSPLSKLLSGANASRGGGGRGGRIRVALVLTLLWRLAKSPHTTIRPARYWAVLLQVDDPDKAGSRTIRSTLLEIERRGFIRTEERGPGKVPEIILMDESLRGVDYKLPYLQAMEEGSSGDTSYFRVPETFWSTGLCAKLSGAGLAMYLIAMSRAGWGNQPSFWLAPAQFRDQYGLGDSTRKKGLRELVDLGVLTHELRSIDRDGHAGYRRFQRSVYTVVASYRTAGASTPEPIEQPMAPEPTTRRRETLVSDRPAGRNKIGGTTPAPSEPV